MREKKREGGGEGEEGERAGGGEEWSGWWQLSIVWCGELRVDGEKREKKRGEGAGEEERGQGSGERRERERRGGRKQELGAEAAG